MKGPQNEVKKLEDSKKQKYWECRHHAYRKQEQRIILTRWDFGYSWGNEYMQGVWWVSMIRVKQGAVGIEVKVKCLGRLPTWTFKSKDADREIQS